MQQEQDELNEYQVSSAAMRRNDRVARASKKHPMSHLSNQRVPSIFFSAVLEKIVMDLWNRKHYFLFRDPVDTTIWSTYLQKVSRPMCLSTIRERLGTL